LTVALLSWSDELSVGDREIDEQHHWLVEKVNSLYYSLATRQDEDLGVTSINDLLNYAWEHFETEENLFRRIGFPEAEEHIGEHQRFAEKVSDYRTRFIAGQKPVFPELLDFLSTWLTEHLRDMDRKYVPYLTGPDRRSGDA
jgi:hemerythrin